MSDILAGLGDALVWTNVIFIALGVLTGTIVGAIPGLNGPMAIALALPVTFYLSPLGGMAYLIGIMKGGTFGGSVSAILLNTPGSPEAAATAYDGYPLAQQGKGLKAMKMALYASPAFQAGRSCAVSSPPLWAGSSALSVLTRNRRCRG
jgi:putative tricarboxylic transport membrane protein